MKQPDLDFQIGQRQLESDHQIPPAGQLFDAIKSHDIRRVERILQDGFIPCDYWIEGKSFLRIAGENGQRAICETLVRFGANPNEAGGKRNYSLLHRAAAAGNFGFAGILLDLGAWHSPVAKNGATPLHLASRSGQAFLTCKLIEYGAHVNVQDNQGKSPLLIAFEKAQVHVAKIIVQKRGDLDLADRSGVTPRMVAESRGPPYSDLIYDR